MNRPTPHPFPLRRPLAALLLALSCGLASAQAPAPAAAASAPAATVRPEVAKPLQAAQELLRSGGGADAAKQALARLAEAAAVPALTPYEQYLLYRLRAVAAFGAGDVPAAITDFEAALQSPLLPPADRLPTLETVAKLQVQTKQYPRAVETLRTYLAAGGQDAQLRRLLPQLLLETGDAAGAAREMLAQVQAAEAAKQPVAESQLRLLAAAQNKAGDDAGYLGTVERLAVVTNQASYWNELLAWVVRREGFSSERLGLDTYRLRWALGLVKSGDELADMAERAQRAGLPAEAQQLLDDARTPGLLATKGPTPAVVQALRQQVAKAVAQDRTALADGEKSAATAKDGNALVAVGFALSASDAARGAALMQQGLAKGGLRRADEAQLHLGIALWRAGRLDDARRAFGEVKGSDGSADLARLWSLWLSAGAQPPR